MLLGARGARPPLPAPLVATTLRCCGRACASGNGAAEGMHASLPAPLQGEPTSAGIAMESPVPLPDGLDSASSSISTSSADGGSGSELEPGACGTGTSADAA